MLTKRFEHPAKFRRAGVGTGRNDHFPDKSLCIVACQIAERHHQFFIFRKVKFFGRCVKAGVAGSIENILNSDFVENGFGSRFREVSACCQEEENHKEKLTRQTHTASLVMECY